MSITIGNKPEQNVVNVGDEISTNQLAAITATAINGSPTATNPFLTRTNTFDTADAAVRITQIGAGDAFVVEDAANPDSSPFVITNTGEVGIGSAPSAGSRLNIQGNLRVIGTYVGTGSFTTTGNINTTQGQLTITNAGTSGLLNLTQSNTGTTIEGAIISYAGTANAFRITNTGTGNSFVVEDSANPDSTAFVISNAGDVTLGGSLTLASGSFSSTTAITINNTNYPHELEFKVGATTYRVPARAI